MNTTNKSAQEIFESGKQPAYGFDIHNKQVEAPKGFTILMENRILQKGDIPFDVYSGWLDAVFYNSNYAYSARSSGRWTTWARPIKNL